MNDLESRLLRIFKQRNSQHNYRAKQHNQPASLDYQDLLANCQEFKWQCPFCDKSLGDLSDSEWNFNHLNGIKHNGNVQSSCVVSCRKCNRILWNSYRDDIDLYLHSLNKSGDLFRERIHTALTKRLEQLEKELAEELSQPSAIQAGVLAFVDHFKNGQEHFLDTQNE